MKVFLQRALLVLSCGFTGTLAVWGQNAPTLTITKQPSIQISVQGLPGSNYQLQHASNLNTTTWSPLTNFTMGSGPMTITDPAAISNQIRFYRALLLNTGNNSGYAPDALTGGEILQLQVPTGFPNTTAKDHLAINSSTTALWVRQSQQLGANPVVLISYQRSGAYSAQLQSIELPSSFQPFARTNFYTLYFTSPEAGFYQVTDGMISSQTGLFTFNRSLVGQQIAAAMITPGQVFNFGDPTNFAAASIVIDSTTNGVKMGTPISSEFLIPVGLHYEKLGPLTYQLDVIFSGSSQLITNKYWGMYQSAATGIFNQLFNSASETFSRGDVSVGAPLAPPQLEAGEIYRLQSFFGPTDIARLLVNTATNSLLLTVPPLPQVTGITPVDNYYTVLGPLHAQLDVIIPPTVNNPSPQTNRYTFVYTTTNTNQGFYQLTQMSGNQTGNFTRDRSLVGQSIASSTLTAGEVYSLQATNNSAIGGATVIINSPTSGSVSWFPSTFSADAGIFPAAIQYTRLGPLGARLEIVTTPPGGSPQLLTNLCYLAYLSTNGGSSQGLINQAFSPNGLGSFIRNQALIGQQITQPQLAAGERYEMIFTGPPATFSNIVTLVVTSPANGLIFWEFPSVFSFESSGLTTVTLNYVPVGPRELQMEIIFPPSDLNPQAQTNLCSFVYSASDSGVLQVMNPPQQTGGLFRRNVSLVGQQPAPFQLTAGESFQIATSNMTSTVTDTLLLDSPTTGILFTQGGGLDAGVFPNTTFSYLRTSDFSAQINAVPPPTPPMFALRTNSFWLIYTTTNTGLTKRSSSPISATLGRFQRQPNQ